MNTNDAPLFRGMMEHTTRRTLTREEIASMSDNDLVVTLGIMMENKFDDENELVGPEIVVYALSLLDMEVMNGGLCQFLTNPSRAAAPFVASALLSVDAAEYEALLAHFLDETGIDLNDLDDFGETSIEGYLAALEAHKDAYEEFDNAYADLYETKPLEELLARYIREHADAFAK